jgi:hypothetical protein
MPATNLLIFMADQHSRKALGCYGHPLARTPNLDALAARGTRFVNAYTNSPLCVPARACFATGRHLHEIGYWDNAIAYDGRVKGWGHRLLDAGHDFVSVGKLHYRFADDPTGVGEQVIPMHIANGKGDVPGSLRPDVPERRQSARLAEEVGPGETAYTRYDRDITSRACDWLAARGAAPADKPWVLFVSYIAPHFPLIVPQDYLDLYPLDDIPSSISRAIPGGRRSTAVTPSTAISATTTTASWRSPVISDYAASSTRISAGSSKRSNPPGCPATPESSTPATMAKTSAPADFGGNRRCTRSRRGSRLSCRARTSRAARPSPRPYRWSISSPRFWSASASMPYPTMPACPAARCCAWRTRPPTPTARC